MCPDPALLVAYLDRTLFSRDVAAVEQHLSQCEECTKLLADMRRHRETPRSAGRWIYVAIPLAVILIGTAVWTLRRETAPRGATAPAAPPSLAPAPAPAVPPPAAAPVKPATSVAVARARPAAPSSTTTRSTPKPPPKPAAVERRAPPTVQWRTRDLAVERSTDGGVTWTIEYVADRPIRASAFVNADVAWLVGENGLVLRRTTNGWFGASAPAEGHLTAVRATSPSRATVTLEDGRVFTTANGGVTWSSP
jgi:hypothetical protein